MGKTDFKKLFFIAPNPSKYFNVIFKKSVAHKLLFLRKYSRRNLHPTYYCWEILVLYAENINKIFSWLFRNLLWLISLWLNLIWLKFTESWLKIFHELISRMQSPPLSITHQSPLVTQKPLKNHIHWHPLSNKATSNS